MGPAIERGSFFCPQKETSAGRIVFTVPAQSVPVCPGGSRVALPAFPCLQEGAGHDESQPEDSGQEYGFAQEEMNPEEGEEGDDHGQRAEQGHAVGKAQGFAPEEIGEAQLKEAEIDGRQNGCHFRKRTSLPEDTGPGKSRRAGEADEHEEGLGSLLRSESSQKRGKRSVEKIMSPMPAGLM